MEEFKLENNQITKNNTQNKKKKILIWTISLILLIGLIVPLIIIFAKNESSSSPKRIELNETYLSVNYIPSLGYDASIKGTAKNNSNRNFSYVSIEFTLYDSLGNNLGTAIANINNFASGDTWNFNAGLLAFPETEPVSYKLVDITSW